MHDTIKQKIYDFILKSYKESDKNDQIPTRNVSIIEEYFFEHADLYDIRRKFAIVDYNNQYIIDIIGRYLEHLSFVAGQGGYTPDEIYFISTLLGARSSKRKAYIKCEQAIAQCKKGYNPDNLVFSISDPIEKLYELNTISRRTLNCLREVFDDIWYNHETKPVITVEDIIYVPKKWLYNIQNMGAKCITEIISFVDNYPIKGRIIPTKEDIKRVLENTTDTIVVDNGSIINMYFLTDMLINDICKQLGVKLNYIQMVINQVLTRMCESACKNEWGLLDLITLSSMIDLYMARSCTYDHLYYYHYTQYIAGRIIDLLSSNK